MSWFDEGSGGSPVDVAKLFDSGVPAVITEIVAAGALVSIGCTSDGGAVGVTVTLDGRWRRGYFRDSDEAVDWLIGARNAVVKEAPSRDASAGRRSRSRRS